MGQESLVYYWVPADGDRAEEPNVFVVHTSPKSICVRDVVSAFPLPGTYHFRFKTAYKTGHVWMDAVDHSAPVPSFRGTFFVKVMRIAAPSLGSATGASSFAETPVRATATGGGGGRGQGQGQGQRQQQTRNTTPARLGVSTPPSGVTRGSSGTRAGVQRSGSGGAGGVGSGLGGATASPSPRQQRRQQRQQQGAGSTSQTKRQPERRLSADSDLLGT